MLSEETGFGEYSQVIDFLNSDEIQDELVNDSRIIILPNLKEHCYLVRIVRR